MVDGHIIELYLPATICAVAIIFVIYVATVHSYLILPFYATEASREFGAHGFMMGNTGAEVAVARTVLRARAIGYGVVVRTHHII